MKYAKIVILETAQEFVLKNEPKIEHIIGRKAQSKWARYPIETNDRTVGRNHCKIEIKASDQGLIFLLTNLSSAKGDYRTVLKRKTKQMSIYPTDQVYLQDRDIIELGEKGLHIQFWEPVGHTITKPKYSK
ncbi:MAG: FHA domain-containing protein [Bacteroidota bacterium]